MPRAAPQQPTQAPDAQGGQADARSAKRVEPTRTSSRAARQRYDGIDLLRICAAGAVLVFHYAYRGAAADGFTGFQLPSLIPVAKYGYLGVELFFIISGFVIAMSAQGRSVAAFARARFLRIYPTFVAAMTMTAVVTLAIGRPPFGVSLSGWLANLTVFPTLLGRPFVDGVYWTLDLEIIFYCWVTLFIRLGWFAKHRNRIVGLWLGVSLVVNAVSSTEILHVLLLTDVAPFFAGGMLLYGLETYELRTSGGTIKTILLLVAAVAMSVERVLSSAAYQRTVLHSTLDDTVLVCIVLGLYAAFVASLGLPRLGRFVAFAGAASYPLYLLHQHLGYMLFNLIGTALPPIVIGLLVVGVIALATIVFTACIEPPARRLTARLLSVAVPSRRLVGSPRMSG